MCSLFKKPLFEVVSDTPYLPGSTSDAHKFDTYLPLGVTGPVPVVLHVHGGGWVRGGRKSWAYGAVPVCSSLASKRMVCFSVGYRLGTPHPHAICDVAAAVAFILAFAAEQHGGDLSRVYLSGHSAGAHLIALLYSDPQYLQKACHHLGIPEISLDTSIKGMICLAGVYSLHNPFGREETTMTKFFRHRYANHIFGTDKDKLLAASPTHLLQQLASADASQPRDESSGASEETQPLATAAWSSSMGGQHDGDEGLIWEEDSVSEESTMDSEAEAADPESITVTEASGTGRAARRPRFLIANAQVDLGLEKDGVLMFEILSSKGFDATYMVVKYTNHITLSIKERVMQRIYHWIQQERAD